MGVLDNIFGKPKWKDENDSFRLEGVKELNDEKKLTDIAKKR